MSHNKIKVGGQSPNTLGEVSVALDNLSSVNLGTPSSDQVLKYDGSEWISSAAPPGTEAYILLGQGETAAYSTSGASTLSTLNNAIHLYDTAPLNTIGGATLNEVTGVSDWYDDITLPAGNYQVTSQVRVEFSASGYFGFAVLSSGNSQLTAKAVIGANASTAAEGVTTTINSVMTLSSQTTVKLALRENASNIDSIANQGNIISEFSYLFIKKVS
jgi:hypothetical protein